MNIDTARDGSLTFARSQTPAAGCGPAERACGQRRVKWPLLRRGSMQRIRYVRPPLRRHQSNTHAVDCSGVCFVFGGAHSSRCRIAFAHVGAVLGISIISCATEVVDFRTQSHPHDSISGAMTLGLSFSRKLIDPSGRRWSGWSRSCGRSRRSPWLSRSRCGWSAAGSRRCRRSGSRLRGCTATATLSDVGLFRNPVGLICSFVRSPLLLTSFCSLLLSDANRG